MKLLIDIPEHIYEHAKEESEDSRDEGEAMRAIANGIQQESRSENPNTCGDAISRQAVLEGIRNLYPDIPIVDIMGARRKWLEKYAPYFECENVVEQLPSVTPKTPQPCEDEDCISRAIVQEEITKSIELKENPYQLWYRIRALPSVSPQQRTGRWIKQNYGWNWQCSECGFVTPPSAKEIFTFCPKCGAKMEVEEC